MSTPKALRLRFPYMFEGRNLGISIAKGWFPLFEDLCTDIDLVLGDDKRGFHWRQVKEKFGASRFYWAWDKSRPSIRFDLAHSAGVISGQIDPELQDGPEAPLMAQINQLVQAAELATRTICIVCGAVGANDSAGGHLLTLCQTHADQRREGQDFPSPWFSKED